MNNLPIYMDQLNTIHQCVDKLLEVYFRKGNPWMFVSIQSQIRLYCLFGNI